MCGGAAYRRTADAQHGTDRGSLRRAASWRDESRPRGRPSASPLPPYAATSRASESQSPAILECDSNTRMMPCADSLQTRRAPSSRLSRSRSDAHRPTGVPFGRRRPIRVFVLVSWRARPCRAACGCKCTVGARHAVPLPQGGIERFGKPISGSFPTIVRSFKSATTLKFHEFSEHSGERLWQRGYYDHIIRNERDYQAIYDYILANPYNWEKDEEFVHL